MKTRLALAGILQRLLIDPNNTSTRVRTNIVISTLALLRIVGGLPAVAEEHGRTPEFLQSKYQELDRKFFDTSLPPVRIEWADLTKYNYLGETYRENDGTFVVLVDRKTNFRDEDLQDTMFHEMCHVATWRQEDDPHGSAFRACMAGIKGKVMQDGQYEGTKNVSPTIGSEESKRIAMAQMTLSFSNRWTTSWARSSITSVTERGFMILLVPVARFATRLGDV